MQRISSTKAEVLVKDQAALACLMVPGNKAVMRKSCGIGLHASH